ncbi:MAG: NADH-quinone oxidoreductase subunit L [Planctomycetia bacterium]|nr:NADH-quinone oxidoreductase subunit L [Planctomycetia bacterium]
MFHLTEFYSWAGQLPPSQKACFLAALIPLFPLAAMVIIAACGGKILKKHSHVPAIIGVAMSFVVSLVLLLLFSTGILGEVMRSAYHISFATWFSAGALHVPFGVYLDPLSVLFISFVTGISLLIFIYSSGYMEGDYGYFRFFAYLSMFVAAMTILVLANNFLLVYLGWEGVGLASYLLIGYYYPKNSARDAATKAFVVNRIGDTCFAIAIFMIYLTFHSLNFANVFYGPLQSANFRAAHASMMFWIPLLLMFGAFAKSAQFPLHVWLPDAMEGPTPVSALIHAATMVTAGVYLIARCMPIFMHDLPVLHLVGIIGTFTAFMAATIAMCQYDLKRIWAYSTVSQLGYMFMGLGVAAGSAAVFHVFTHAFFKALLFLSTGSVMHAMGGELDIRKMSGLARRMPITAVCLLMGALALAGFPGWAGFFSKDAILSAAMNSAWSGGPWLAVVGLITALITAYYTFRAFFRVFMGDLVLPRTAGLHEPSVFTLPADTDHERHADAGGHDNGPSGHDAHSADHQGRNTSFDGPISMWGPLVILAIGATTVGWLGVWGGHGDQGWIQSFLSRVPMNAGLRYVPTPPAGLPLPVTAVQRLSPAMGMTIGGTLAVLGILIAFYFHWVNRHAADIVKSALRPVVTFLENKWYFDEIYHYGLVMPLWFLGRILYGLDHVLDGIVVNFFGYFPQFVGWILKPTQSGRLRYYAIGMVSGLVFVILGVLYLLR